MSFAYLRRLSWLLVLVLGTGLGTPLLATAAQGDATVGAVTHRHADGSVHSHGGIAGHNGAASAAGGNTRKPDHCKGCLTDAACAVSCLGMALLPATAEWRPISATAAWNPAAHPALPGVSPDGETDPPRPLFRS